MHNVYYPFKKSFILLFSLWRGGGGGGGGGEKAVMMFDITVSVSIVHEYFQEFSCQNKVIINCDSVRAVYESARAVNSCVRVYVLCF